MDFTPEVVAFLQWIINQGLGVAVALGVLYLVGRKVDQQNQELAKLTLAITRLSVLVESHMPGAGPPTLR